MTQNNPIRQSQVPLDLSDAAADLLAAIVIDAQNIRMEVARLEGRRYRRIESLQENIPLGKGLDTGGWLDGEGLHHGLAALSRLAERLAAFAPCGVRAVAGGGVRDAVRREEFLSLGAAALGHPIELISGREEARLLYGSVVGLRPIGAERHLMVEIGSRSTEMVLGEGCRPLATESFAIGCLELSRRFFADGGFTQPSFQRAQVAAGAALEEAVQSFAPHHWSEALSSSTITQVVSHLLSAHRISDGAITREGLHWCIEQCLEAGSLERLELGGLSREQCHALGGGLSILMSLFTQFDIEVLRPTSGTLAQGVIFDLGERLGPDAAPGRESLDARNEAVRQLQQRFRVDMAQAERVREWSLRFHEALAPDASPGSRSELAWAAALHELGMAVSHHDHHHHSAYLITHADAAGFSQSQQRRLGKLLLGQRGRLRKIGDVLAEPSFLAQLVALRLAVLLCQGRSELPAEAIRVSRLASTAVVSLQAEWAQQNMTALYRLQEEKACWERSEVMKLALKIERRSA